MVNLQVSKVTTVVPRLNNLEAAAYLKSSRFIFAFPGMGKTPLAMKRKGFADADFGFFRTAFKVEKAKESELFKPYTRLIKMIADQGYKVLINQPDIMGFVPANQAVCLLPATPKYSAKKMDVDPDTISKWIDGWEDTAKRLGVKCVRISVGLDML